MLVVLTAHDCEAQNVVSVVQNLQPFGAALRRKPRHHANLSCAPHGAIARHGATANEMLVRLRFVETAHHGLEVRNRCQNPLNGHVLAMCQDLDF